MELDAMVRLIEMLEEGASGQRIAEELGISRTSVWKMIRKLEEMGYVISAKRKVGYKLLKRPDLSPYEVARVCKNSKIVKEIRYYRTTDSTNERAKEIGKTGVLVIAERQTTGKGRFGRRWISEPGGLYFSLTLDPLPIEDVPKLTLTAGVAVAEAIGGKLKWPNDVLIEGRKVCGILCELTGEVENPIVIVGIGINVNNPVPEYAISLKEVHGKDLNRSQVLGRVIERFEFYYEKLLEGKWEKVRERWKKLSDTLGKFVVVRVAGKEFRGLAKDLAENGALILKRDGEEIRVFSGECFYI